MRRIILAFCVALTLLSVVGVTPERGAAHDLVAPSDKVAQVIPGDAPTRYAPPRPKPHHPTKTPPPAQHTGYPRAIYHTQTYRNTGDPGSCVWFAMRERPDLYLSGAGSAANLARLARSRGYAVGLLPAVGALVVMQPGVDFAYWPSAQYASSVFGHVAYVLAVYPDGSYLMASMASPAKWVVTDWRGRPGSGISFIYG